MSVLVTPSSPKEPTGACASTFDSTAPLAVALLQAGLSEQQIVQDNWTALMSLPQDAVRALMTRLRLTDADHAVLERHATLDLLKVTPSSALSCETWCSTVVQFATATATKDKCLLGTAPMRDALLTLSHQATTPSACYWWCAAMTSLADSNTKAQHVLGTAAVRDALVALGAQATTYADIYICKEWCSVICSLTANNDANKALLRVDSVCKAHAALQGVAAMGADARTWWANAAAVLGEPEGRKADNAACCCVQ